MKNKVSDLSADLKRVLLLGTLRRCRRDRIKIPDNLSPYLHGAQYRRLEDKEVHEAVEKLLAWWAKGGKKYKLGEV